MAFQPVSNPDLAGQFMAAGIKQAGEAIGGGGGALLGAFIADARLTDAAQQHAAAMGRPGDEDFIRQIKDYLRQQQRSPRGGYGGPSGYGGYGGGEAYGGY